jgi:tetratricopeptide (TPR) repeat protein
LVRDLTHRAQVDFQSSNYSAARSKLRKALEISPRDPALWNYLGLTDEQLGDLDSAITDFSRALSLMPGYAPTYFNLGRLYQRGKQTDRALAMYRQGLLSTPDDVTANQNYALLLMTVGHFREAISPLRKLSILDKSDSSIRATLIECYLKAALPDEASKEIQNFLREPEASVEDKLNLAKLLRTNKFPDFALPVLQQVIQLEPGSAKARAEMGMWLLDKGEFPKATEEFRLAVQSNPQSLEYCMRLAESLILGEHYQDAYQFLTSIRDQFGSSREYRFKVGIALYGMRTWTQAITVLEQLEREDPTLDLVQYYLGNSYNNLGNLDRAISHLRKAIALNPNQGSYYVALAKALRWQRDANVDEIITNLNNALTLDPSDFAAKQELALCYESKGDYAKAEELLKQVVLQKPELISAHVILSRIYYRERKTDAGATEKRISQDLAAAKRKVEERIAPSP